MEVEGAPGAATRPPAATCRDCGFAWYSAALARGLRLLGSCPRCAGRLTFSSPKERDAPDDHRTCARAPHLVFALPRGRTRRTG